MNRSDRKFVSLAASICWLLLTIVNCSAVQALPVEEMPSDIASASLAHSDHQHAPDLAPMHMDHDQMACCDSASTVCCEPVAAGLPNKFDDVAKDPSAHPLAMVATQAALTGWASSCFSEPPDWRLQISSPSLHLVNCSFLD